MSSPLLAYALIWALFLAVRPARAVVLSQLRALGQWTTAARLALGCLCGAVLVAVNAVLLVRLRAYVVAGPALPPWHVLVAVFGYVAAVACTEEMIVRGLLLTRLREVASDAVAVLATTVVFAVMHLGRADFGAWSVLQYAADGILLGWLVLATGNIWAGVGFHLAKNLGVMLAFGTAKRLLTPLLAPVDSGVSAIVTGSADLAAYAVAIVLAVTLFRAPKSRSR